MNTDQTVFARNIALLFEKSPDIAQRLSIISVPEHYAVEVARSGDPVLKINNRTVHSLYDPHKEAVRFVERQLEKNPPMNGRVTVIGFGFGYHIEELVRRGFQVKVVEPDPAALRCCLEHRDMREVISACVFEFGSETTAASEKDSVMWCYAPAVDNRSQSTAPRLDKQPSRCYQSTERCRKSLTILVVSPIYGGSLPIARYCDRALRQLGHNSRLWDASMFEKPMRMILDLSIDHQNKKILFDLFQHLISEMIVATCAEVRPDMVLCLAQAPLSLAGLDRLRDVGIISAFWFVEDYRFMPYWQQYAPVYDYYFVIQRGYFMSELQKVGARNIAYLPVGADPEIHRPVVLTQDEKARYGSDLSFVGAGYYNRQQMFCGLLDFDFKIWGTEWDKKSILWQRVQRNGERIETDEMVKIFNASKINLNLHSSAYHEGIRPDCDFINPRTFEIASCAAFQLVDYHPQLEEFFDIGKEIVCFSSLEELRDKATFYLKHPASCTTIAQAAQMRVHSEHTYVHRMQTMCECIYNQTPEIFAKKKSGSLFIRDVEAFCTEHPEVRPLIEEVNAKGFQLDLDSIVAAIRMKHGKMDYPETLFMIMKEYQALVQEHLR